MKVEADILKVLRDSKENILNDEKAIQTLKESQEISDKIKRRQQDALHTEKRLVRARQNYQPISSHSAMLFFLISKLSLVDVMYQYSLNWFIGLYEMSVIKSRKKLQNTSTEDQKTLANNSNTQSLSMLQQQQQMSGTKLSVSG